MELQFIESEYVILMESISLMVFIHEHGTSPNSIPSGAALAIRPNQVYTVKYSTIVNERLPHPYSSKCVSPKSTEHQWKNNFYQPNRPYLYTYEECLSSCKFNSTIDSEFCIHGNSSWQYDYIQYNQVEHQGRLDISLDHLSKKIDRTQCKRNQCLVSNCEIGCRDVKYSIDEIIHSTLNKTASKQILDYALDRIDSQLNSDSNNYTCFNDPSWLILKPKKLLTTIITEEAAMGLSTLLCDIGGTLGLWIGISVLSLVELHCLIVQKIAKIFYYRYR
ncbi:hypothetical protein CHUAL_014017 [Chamberlinius hualienensis]